MSQRIEKIGSDMPKKSLDRSFQDVEKYRLVSSKMRLLKVADRVSRSLLHPEDKSQSRARDSTNAHFGKSLPPL